MSLFKTTAELKTYLSIDGNTKFATLLPYIKQAEAEYIIVLIGQDLFDQVNTAFNGADPLPADIAKILPYIQKAVAYYAMMLSVNELSVTFGDQGVRDNSNSDQSMPAPKWKQEKLERQAMIKADTAADQLLKFLEDNADNVTYNSWFEDLKLNTRMSGTIVYSTAIASRYIDISNSRRLFLKLRSAINEIESSVIKNLIGIEQYIELINELQDDTVSAENGKLLAYLEPIIAKRALHVRLPFLNVAITETGLFNYSGTDDLRSAAFKASKDEVSKIMDSLKCGLTGFESNEQQLKDFIYANIADYPLIAASSAYTSRPVPGPVYSPLNDQSNGFFSV